MFGSEWFIACSGNGHILSKEIREEINHVIKGGKRKIGVHFTHRPKFDERSVVKSFNCIVFQSQKTSNVYFQRVGNFLGRRPK
jgi:hypothetical protein